MSATIQSCSGMRVYACHLHSLLDEEASDRLASRAAEVEHPAAAGQPHGERVDPNPIVPAAAPPGYVPLHGVSSVEVDHTFGRVVGHR
jgi:hypothetical protein